MDKVIFKIKRFDGTKEWYQEYKFAYEKNKTVLWALIKIRDEIDASLNFTSACRSAICGSCGIRVNGNAILACKTSLDEMLEVYKTSKLTIEPLANYTVIRDLVVDWEPKFARMTEVNPWLMADARKVDDKGFCQSEQDFNKISNPTDCILCGCCASECTQLTTNGQGFYEPFIFTKSYRFTADTRDNNKKVHFLPALEKGLWKCVRCMQCVTKCPKGVKPGEHIGFLRQESMQNGYKNNKGARHAYAFYNDINSTGRLNEITLPFKTEGLVSTLNRIPFALRLFRKGKISPLHMPKSIKGIEEIKKVFEMAEKEAN